MFSNVMSRNCRTLILGALQLVLLFSLERPASAQIFRSDDPISVDRDDRPIPQPRRRKINDYYDFLENTFFNAGDKTAQRATNINTLGEVPDSSWFTNRTRLNRLPTADLVRGANRGS